MNEYQSMELHHGATIFVGSYPDWVDMNDYDYPLLGPDTPPFIPAQRSAVGGGRVIFSDDEDITKWPEHDRFFGPPKELTDLKFLDYILNTNKWETTFTVNVDSTVEKTFPDGEVFVSTGSHKASVKGFFDYLYVEHGDYYNAYEAGDGYEEDYGYRYNGTIRRRDTEHGKASQLDPSEYDSRTSRVEVLRYSSPNIVTETATPATKYYQPYYNRSLLPYIAFKKEDLIYHDEGVKTYTIAETKAGSAEVEFTVQHSEDGAPEESALEGEVSMPYLLITPTKVYAWIHVELYFGGLSYRWGHQFYGMIHSNPLMLNPYNNNPANADFSEAEFDFLGTKLMIPTRTRNPSSMLYSNVTSVASTVSNFSYAIVENP